MCSNCFSRLAEPMKESSLQKNPPNSRASLFARRRGGGGGRTVTQHADEEGLVDQFVALRVHQVELERQAAALLPLLVAVVQQAWRDSQRVKGRAIRRERAAGRRSRRLSAPLLTSSWVKLWTGPLAETFSTRPSLLLSCSLPAGGSLVSV